MQKNCSACPPPEGFTLAEVLITLGIIGIVAAITMPTLIQKHREKELAVGIRKIYADISNALKLSQVQMDGSIDYSTVFNPDNTSYESTLAFVKYFNSAKVCKDPNAKGCSNLYHSLKFSRRYEAGTGKAKDFYPIDPAIVLNNGAMLYIYQSKNPDCYSESISNRYDEQGNKILDENGNPLTLLSKATYCAIIYFDVNGPKGPNRFGQDASRFLITKTQVLPSAQPYEGRETLINIISGVDKFVYEDYKVGE